MTELRMLENSWASEYLRGLFAREGKSLEDLDDLVIASEVPAMDDPSLELNFLMQGKLLLSRRSILLLRCLHCAAKMPR